MPHWAFDVAGGMVVGASLLHTFLPPWDVLADFPKAQKVYKVVVYTVGYIAINGRSSVYRSISTQDGTAVSPVNRDEPPKPT